MFENPRRGRQARNCTTNAPKILDLNRLPNRYSSENCRWVPLILENTLIVSDWHNSRPLYWPQVQKRLQKRMSCLQVDSSQLRRSKKKKTMTSFHPVARSIWKFKTCPSNSYGSIFCLLWSMIFVHFVLFKIVKRVTETRGRTTLRSSIFRKCTWSRAPINFPFLSSTFDAG